MEKKVLLGASYSFIEPLGLLHLSTIAKQEGYKTKIVLAKKEDLKDLDALVDSFNPDFLGFTVYTGNHTQAIKYFDELKKRKPEIKIILGGPHATYFPEDCISHSDYVVLSEGFDSFRRILKSEVEPGIVHLRKQESFPATDRENFYQDYQEFKKSKIKSIITQTGCPFSCTYCYNSGTLEDISSSLNQIQREEMEKAIRPLGRLFPRSLRPVEEVINEIAEIKRVAPETEMIYFQDDVFVGVGNDWINEFTKRFMDLGLEFHAQLRFEYADPKSPKARERLEKMREAGCSGLTIAIESADPVIRKEVLNRHMKEDLMFEVFQYLNSLGYKVRTEQMLGLPCGATKEKTKVNLESDLETLGLNIRLKKETGLPTMAWASIFAPYKGTKISDYCLKHGFYCGRNSDFPITFFERSVLNFPKEWIGPELCSNRKEFWLTELEQEKHRNKLQLLRDLFTQFALIPEGQKLAQDFLNQEDYSHAQLSKMTRRHLYDKVLYDLG